MNLRNKEYTLYDKSGKKEITLEYPKTLKIQVEPLSKKYVELEINYRYVRVNKQEKRKITTQKIVKTEAVNNN